MKLIPNKKRNFRGNFQNSLLYSAAIGGSLKTSQSVSFECRRTALQEHKFQIGQTVYFTSRPIGHMVANSTYQVVKLLPSDGADYQYRIKNANEAFERVARESQLEFTR
jgi:hypothetical protein